MTTAFNSPVESAVRILNVLAVAHPVALDINQLVLLDHALLHSADLGGPESLHPPLPARVGELAVKRARLEQGAELLLRVGLAEMRAGSDGLQYSASDSAWHFLSLLESPYASRLADRARWVVGRFPDLGEPVLREALRAFFDAWAEEFASATQGEGLGHDT